tara:strand:+ start:126 stop:395 length:270 start_codon:yes stop_codon:yes gene_type:complete
METKVIYKKDKVALTMDSSDYKNLLDGYNNLKNTTQMIAESQDLYLTYIEKLNKLQFEMYRALGFCRPDGGCYGCDAVMSNDPNAEVKK